MKKWLWKICAKSFWQLWMLCHAITMNLCMERKTCTSLWLNDLIAQTIHIKCPTVDHFHFTQRALGNHFHFKLFSNLPANELGYFPAASAKQCISQHKKWSFSFSKFAEKFQQFAERVSAAYMSLHILCTKLQSQFQQFAESAFTNSLKVFHIKCACRIMCDICLNESQMLQDLPYWDSLPLLQFTKHFP